MTFDTRTGLNIGCGKEKCELIEKQTRYYNDAGAIQRKSIFTPNMSASPFTKQKSLQHLPIRSSKVRPTRPPQRANQSDNLSHRIRSKCPNLQLTLVTLSPTFPKSRQVKTRKFADSITAQAHGSKQPTAFGCPSYFL